ncbi:unnamed protein product [Ceutorhynchus assimilis]|uniref:Uncharacterized protein n=1 Tax=Ceutorhynchus assimilis TaxID=467358 RepID=A0A9N9QKJ7_9CUCU|nr:unnamed protein product [Ceutorhynchus assimilis]
MILHRNDNTDLITQGVHRITILGETKLPMDNGGSEGNFEATKKVVTEVVKPEALINGFRACGLYPFNPEAIDYSKCLGKLNKAIEENNSDPVMMDGKIFSNFVGGDIIARFKSYDAILIKEGFTPEFLALHRMWRYFGNPIETGVENALAQIDTELSNEPENFNHDKRCFGNPKETEVENALTQIDTDLRNEPENPNNDDKTTEGNENNINSEIDSITMIEPSKSEAVHVFANVIIRNVDDSSRTSSPVFITDSNCKNSPDIETIRQETENSELPKASNVQINNSTTDSIHKSSSPASVGRCIEDYLKIPDKPQRKNKRQVERVSFAITSRLYQENFEAKKAIKLEEENKKIERKRKREEKAATKTNLKNKKVCKSNQNKINAICSVCKKRLTKSKHWTCNSCHKKFHNLCIPKKHKEHVPDIGDEDLFMCHNCYEEENDEDSTISEESFDDLKNEGDGFSGDQRLKIEELMNLANNNNCLASEREKDTTRTDDARDANLPDANLIETCQEENQERPEIDEFYSVKLVSDDLDELNPYVEQSTLDEDQDADELFTMYKNAYKKF